MATLQKQIKIHANLTKSHLSMQWHIQQSVPLLLHTRNQRKEEIKISPYPYLTRNHNSGAVLSDSEWEYRTERV